jgi:hypothetical protein
MKGEFQNSQLPLKKIPLGKFECQCGLNLSTLLVFCDKVFVSSMAKK